MNLQARPATENKRKAMYPLVVDEEPLLEALPVVDLIEDDLSCKLGGKSRKRT